MKYIDLFGGIGGFSLGIERATNNTEREYIPEQRRGRTDSEQSRDKSNSQTRKARWDGSSTNNKFRWECVYYNDFDKYAVQTYNKNFGTDYEATDITTIKATDIPDHDLICAGFPCQAFSIAGKRRGFEDTRGTLFFDIMRIAKAKRTPYLFLENVKGLLNHEKGKTFTKILQTLQELGYEYQWMVLNSKFFGVPQNRERVFIIANLRGKPRPEILPFRENATEVSEVYYETQDSRPEIGQAKRRYGIKGISPPLQNWSPMISTTYKAHRADQIRKHEGSPTLTSNMGTGGNNVPMVVMNLQKRSADRPALTKICPCGSKKLYQKCCGSPAGSGTIGKVEEAYCLDSNASQGVGSLTNNLRRLTPIECERLQGYPDDWTSGVSNTQRYKQCGNAVTVNVIEAIIRSWTNRPHTI